MKSFIIASVATILLTSQVHCQEDEANPNFKWMDKNFTTVACTSSNEATTCGPLAAGLGMDLCCATIVVRQTSSSGRQQYSGNQCYPRLLADKFPNSTAGGYYA